MHYLILSAINDIKYSNREASSLLFIVNLPYICAGTERAFNYAMLCTENAKIFNDQGRSFDIVKAHAKITRAYQKRLENNIVLCLVSMGITDSVSIAGFCIIRRRPFTIIVCVCAITHAYPRRTLPTPSHRCMPTNSSAIRSESSVCRDCRTICAC